MKHDLSFYQTPLFMNLIDAIEREVAPEKIYLLSVSTHKHYSENIFTQHPIESDRPSQFDLLILLAENEQRNRDVLQDIIENKCSEGGFVTVLIFPLHQFNKWLMSGHPFAYRVYHTAQLCYDAGRVPLAIPDQYNREEVQNRLFMDFNRNMQLASEFLSGAELFTIRKQLPLAAFHLHQATEQLYTGIIRMITGLRVQTHNLDKLYRYSRHLREGLTDVFPRDNQDEKHVFKLLQKAYIESRYRNDFKIRQEEVSLLHDRVRKLSEVCEHIKRSTYPTA